MVACKDYMEVDNPQLVGNMEALGRTEAEGMVAPDSTAVGNTVEDMQLVGTVAADTLEVSAGTVVEDIQEVSADTAVEDIPAVSEDMEEEDIPAVSEDRLAALCKLEVPLGARKVDMIQAVRQSDPVLIPEFHSSRHHCNHHRHRP